MGFGNQIGGDQGGLTIFGESMPGQDVQIASTEGGRISCYLARPSTRDRVPAVVLAASILGVDADIRSIADEFAGYGYVAAAPDLFWRSFPGPLPRGSAQAARRAQPRARKIEIGETDMADTLTFLAGVPEFNGRALAMGFCYGGPYALIGPKRLGYAAGVSCHGSEMLDYIREIEEIAAPVSLLWGDRDERAPRVVLDAFSRVAACNKIVDVRLFGGVGHGYMMRSNRHAFSAAAHDASMARALSLLHDLRGPGPSAT